MSESRKTVLMETALVFVGVMVCVAVMLGIYGLIGKLDIPVLLGSLVGTVVAVANFFFMAVMVTLAADKAESGDPQAGQKLIKSAYPIRILVLAAVLFTCANSGLFDLMALVLPLIFVRPTVTAAEFFRKKGA